MIITEIGKDIISVNEDNYLDEIRHKIHIIKLEFKYPNRDKMDAVLSNYKKTNRFIISNNIKLYNNYLRNTSKKYYVMNNINDGIITHYKKNNKIVLNTHNLNVDERRFLLSDAFLIDALCNLEVLVTHKHFYEIKSQIFKNWPGNLILTETNDF